jgi:gluconokinase
VVTEGDATITIGSSGAVRVAGKQVLVDEKQRFFNYILTEGTYISGGPTNNGGVVFEWFVQQFGASGINTDMEYSINQLLMQAERVPAGARGLLFLPYLLGERAPLWNANARGAYIGVNITHERTHFIRATVEGIIYEVYSIGKLLQQYRSIQNLYINGVYATLPLFAQILSDVFGKTVYINDKHDSASAGAALLASTKLGRYENLEEASRTIKSVKTYSPNDSNHQQYGQLSEIFDRLSYKLAEDFDDLVALQG